MDQKALGKAFELTEEQVRQYWEDGFLVINNVITLEELQKYREISELPEVTQNRSATAYNNETVHMLGLCTIHEGYLELARHPAIVRCLQQLIGPDVQLQHSKLATKPPKRGAGVFPWHQDYMFYPHTNTDMLSVMVMLDDATVENGCMQMVKGSHKLGFLDHTNEQGLFTGNCIESNYWQDKSAVVDITPKAGGISLHHGLTLHGSGPNLSGMPRRGIVYSYRADDAYQLADGVWTDTGFMICGKRKEQVRCDAGIVRLPKTRRYPGYPFGHAWNQDGEAVKQRDYFLKADCCPFTCTW